MYCYSNIPVVQIISNYGDKKQFVYMIPVNLKLKKTKSHDK